MLVSVPVVVMVLVTLPALAGEWMHPFRVHMLETKSLKSYVNSGR